MIRYVVVSLAGGLLFGTLDALIHANPLAQRLFAFYQPIARTSLNPVTGMVIDVVYGFVMAMIFLLLYPSLPGESRLLKGISFALLAWFFRVVMDAASHWMMFQAPPAALLYSLAAGLVEMLILGILFGLALRPAA